MAIRRLCVYGTVLVVFISARCWRICGFFVAVLIAASVVELLRRRGGYMLASVVILLISTSLWLINPQWTKPKGTPDLSVSLIQGNIRKI